MAVINTNIGALKASNASTMADKMLSDPSYRAYNHFYAGQEAVATGISPR